MPTDPLRPFAAALRNSVATALPGQQLVASTHRLVPGMGFISAHRLVSGQRAKPLMAGLPSVTSSAAAEIISPVKPPRVPSTFTPPSLALKSVSLTNQLGLSTLITRPAVLPTPRMSSIVLDALKPVWSGAFLNLGTSILERVLPANLVPLAAEMDLEQLWTVLGAEGIALGSVPRTALAAALLEAPTEQARRAILGRRLLEILDDCQAGVQCITAGPLCGAAAHLVAAVGTARAGHLTAAQALFANVLDTALRQVYGHQERAARTSRKLAPTAETFKRYPVRESVAVLPVWAAYAQFNTDHGNTVPWRFNRHATAHCAGSRRQFTKRNTAQAALVAASTLIYLHTAYC